MRHARGSDSEHITHVLTFEYEVEGTRHQTSVSVHDASRLEDDATEPMLYDPFSPGTATPLDHLPAGTLCADGGAGGQGGGSSNPGSTGADGVCSGSAGATAPIVNMYRFAPAGGPAGAASNASPAGLGAGGGGGGGAAG